MKVLIVEHNPEISRLWASFLERQGMTSEIAETGAEAYEALRERAFAALVLDVNLADGEALQVADFASYRNPDIAIIAVTPRDFFSDGAIFELIPNARGLLRAPARPEDMAALVEHYGGKSVRSAASG